MLVLVLQEAAGRYLGGRPETTPLRLAAGAAGR
jgi:hypothetical protein